MINAKKPMPNQKKSKPTSTKFNNQIGGNVGMYYVCYKLSRLGWNVMPTARNAKGIDLLIYNEDGSITHTIQVKALSKRNPVPLGSSTANLFGDFFIICRYAMTDTPECFVLTPEEVKSLAFRSTKKMKDGATEKPSYWLQLPAYENLNFQGRWERIGEGQLKPRSTPDPTER